MAKKLSTFTALCLGLLGFFTTNIIIIGGLAMSVSPHWRETVLKIINISPVLLGFIGVITIPIGLGLAVFGLLSLAFKY